MYICNTGTRAVKWGSLKSCWLIPSWVRIPPSVHTWLAQSVERLTFNQVVGGSSPPSGVCSCSSVVRAMVL